MSETPSSVHGHLHVKLGQVLPDEPGGAGPPDAGVHLDGGVGQVLWERRRPRQPELHRRTDLTLTHRC